MGGGRTLGENGTVNSRDIFLFEKHFIEIAKFSHSWKWKSLAAPKRSFGRFLEILSDFIKKNPSPKNTYIVHMLTYMIT